MKDRNKTKAQLINELNEMRRRISQLETKCKRVEIVQGPSKGRRLDEPVTQMEQRYRSLFEQAPVMYVLARIQGNVPVIEECNQLFASVLCYRRDEIRGRCLADFHTAESRTKLLEGDGYPRSLAGYLIAQECQLLTSDGRIVETLLRVTLETTPDGRVSGIRAIYVDIAERKRVEQAMRESEERFRRVVSSIRAHVYMTEVSEDTSKVNRYLSPNVEDLTGYPLERFMDDWHFWALSIIYPDDRGLAAAQAVQLARGQDSEVEYRLVRADGQIIWVRDSARVESEGSHKIVFGVVSDITEHKRVEEALRESEARFRRLVEYAADALFVIHPDGRIMDANRLACDSLGYAREELLNLYVSDIEESYSTRKQAARMMKLLTPGVPVTRRGTHRRKDGTAFPVEIRIGLLEVGKNPLVLALVRDVTERKQAEEALRKARDELEQRVEERTAELATANATLKGQILERQRAEAALAAERNLLRTLIDNLPDQIYVKDRHGRFLLTNIAQAHSLGVNSPDKLVGKTDFDFFPHELAEQYQADEQQIIETGQPLINYVEPTTYGQTGNQAWTATTKVPLRDSSGRATGLVCISRDVTRQQQINRLKTEFLSTAAHELRTPLTSILGFSEILLTRQLDPLRQQSYLRLMLEQSTHLAKIIDDLLDISRLEAGRGLDLKLERVNVAKLLKEAVMPFAETASEHVIQLEGMWEPPLVIGDPFRLAQVVRNLLSNAIKYSPEGGKVTIRGRVIPDYLEISVQDEGVGMLPEEQEQLFEPFYRVDTAPGTIGGTGLGLTISKLIVEQHGGEIWVESEREVGTTVYFKVPLAEDHAKGSM